MNLAITASANLAIP